MTISAAIRDFQFLTLIRGAETLQQMSKIRNQNRLDFNYFLFIRHLSSELCPGMNGGESNYRSALGARGSLFIRRNTSKSVSVVYSETDFRNKLLGIPRALL